MINLDSGYATLFSIKDVPIRVHWSLPFGLLLLAGINPLAWLLFVFIIFAHEAGHAFAINRYRHEVQSIDLWGLGGFCRWYPLGHATPTERSVIAWGGVLAQAAILAVAGIAVLIFGYPTGGYGYMAANFFIEFNLILIGLNLIPISPLDGHEAWKLVTRKFAK